MDKTQIIFCGELVNSYGRGMMLLDFAPEAPESKKRNIFAFVICIFAFLTPIILIH